MIRTKEIKVTPHYFDHVLTQDYKVVIQIGGRFSGKSHNEEIRLVSNLASKKDYKLLVIEDLETGMADGFHSGIYARIDDFEQTGAYTPQSRVAHVKNLYNGNEVLFRGYATEQQRRNVKKLVEVTEILVEEGEWMDYESFVGLLQQLRGRNEQDRRLTILMNPVNPDCFVNEMFIEQPPDLVKVYFPDGRPKVFEKHIKTVFELGGELIEQVIVVLVVLSTHYDNPYLSLDQRASIEQLAETDPDLYMQLGQAKFIRPAGTYFKEFRHGTHTCLPFVIPPHWDRYTTTDYGLDMMATLWIAVDTEGNSYVYKELYESNLIISEAAAKYKAICAGDKIRTKYAPPDLWNRRQETGKSAYDIFAENGVVFVKSNNSRIQGWYAVKEWLKPYQRRHEHTGEEITTSRLKFFSTCTNIIRTLPQLQCDKSDANDTSNEPHELTHAPDALRGYCTMRRRPSTDPVKPFDRDNTRTIAGKPSNIDDYFNMNVR